jgi:hypothetical protein
MKWMVEKYDRRCVLYSTCPSTTFGEAVNNLGVLQEQWLSSTTDNYFFRFPFAFRHGRLRIFRIDKKKNRLKQMNN